MTEPGVLPTGTQYLAHSMRLPAALPAPGRVPRVARLLALAHKLAGLLQPGIVGDYTTLARLGQVSRARITQIMNLLHLAPDIQEEILFLPRTKRGRDPLQLRHLQPLAQVLDWRGQHALWHKLLPQKYPRLRTESPGGSATDEVTDERLRP